MKLPKDAIEQLNALYQRKNNAPLRKGGEDEFARDLLKLVAIAHGHHFLFHNPTKDEA